MRAIFLLAASLFLVMGQTAGKQDSPKSAEELWKINVDREATFLGLLKVVDEPSLLELSKDKAAQSYRFSWIPSANRPMSVRLDVLPDGSGLLTTKFYGKPKPESGFSESSSEVSIPKEEVATFVASVHKLGLWNLPYEEKPPKGVYVLDGVRCIFEEVDKGTYNVIERLSPQKGPMMELSNAMYRWAHRSQ
ncbi:MAG TPA: hypothetical protein VN025_08455 [Candidatus Dormibacteraeota bacterium]|jgi:hypothetical protein|nr:hypothetical protein [Candidatus Dormibacteraeota bacterium]